MTLNRAMSEANLTEALGVLVQPIDQHVLSDCSRRIALGQSHELREFAARELAHERQRTDFRILQSAAVRLVLDDPALSAAWGSINRTTKWSPIEHVTQHAITALLEERVDSLGTFAPEYAEERAMLVLDKYSAIGVKWSILVTHALHEYFYDSEAIARVNATRTRLQYLEAAARAGAAAIAEITRMVVSEHASPTQLIDKAPETAEGQIVNSLMRKIMQLNRTLPPVIRAGETAKERLLIYRLCVAHHLLFGSIKPTAIHELLHIRGVRTLDRRNVDRACQAFSPRTRYRGMSDYRRLLAKIRAQSAGAFK